MLKSLALLLPLLTLLTLAAPVRAATTTIDSTKTYQTIEGFGGAVAFYESWVSDHPYKQEIYTNAFVGLNLSMLRLGNWYRYPTVRNFDTPAFDIVSNANRVLGHPVPILMSSWAPPAFLKSNGQVGNGGTLSSTNGVFAYTNFANYWFDSLAAYRSNGVSPTWISIQNEPDWAASYDSCVFHPTEDTVAGTNYASYSKALNATFQRLTNLASPPKILAPEVVGIGYNEVQNYAATMNASSFYGITHHLYGGSTDGTPDGYIAAMRGVTNVFPSKPHFMTEYGVTNMIQAAWLIHDCLTVEQVSAYNFWSLVWPLANGLINQENPYSLSSWTNAPPGTATQSHGYWLAPSYWAMKHFSFFVTAGFKRISTTDTDPNVLTSSYLSSNSLRLVVVLINTNASMSSAMTLNYGTFLAGKSSVFQTVGTNTWRSLGTLTNAQVLPPLSLTTVVLDQIIVTGPASNPMPTNGTAAVPLNTVLSWTPGSNAVTHALYLGTSSSAVAQASPASPLFFGNLTTTNFSPALVGGTTYFWRVDEIAGANTNFGVVWSFSPVPVPLLVHRYSFSEASGTNVTDSVSGPGWNGTLPHGGTFGGGQLTLSSNTQQYVNLPPGILSANPTNSTTIEAWATFAPNLPWASWFFGFGNIAGSSGDNYLFCSEGGGRFALTGVNPGYNGETNVYTPGLNWSGLTLHLACVVDPANGAITIYTNGALSGTNALGTYTLAVVSNNYSYLNRSLYSGDPYVNLVLNEFRIYSRALTATEIAATDALGPDQVLDSGSPPVGLAAMDSGLTLTWPLTSASFTLQVSPNLAPGSWMPVTSPAPQMVGTNYQLTLSASNAPLFFRLAR